MRVGFDLDGVLYDFGASVRRYLDSIGQPYGWKDDAAEPHCWDFYEYWGMSRAEFRKVCDDGVDAGYVFSGPARPNAVEAVERVAAAGHDIIIITDRQFGSDPKNSHRATYDWLAQHNIFFNEIAFSADKTCLPTHTFVEDKLENHDALVRAGVDSYLINRAWNNPAADGRKRILDVLEYAEIIERYEIPASV